MPSPVFATFAAALFIEFAAFVPATVVILLTLSAAAFLPPIPGNIAPGIGTLPIFLGSKVGTAIAPARPPIIEPFSPPTASPAFAPPKNPKVLNPKSAARAPAPLTMPPSAYPLTSPLLMA